MIYVSLLFDGLHRERIKQKIQLLFSMLKFVEIITDSLLQKCKQNKNKSHIFSHHFLFSLFFFLAYNFLRHHGVSLHLN